MYSVVRVSVFSRGGGVRRFSISCRQMQTTPVLDTISKQVQSDNCVIYMKGTPDRPMCGFSRAAIEVLRINGAKFTAHDVLSNEELRSGIKEFSKWPTIPQIFLKGEFIGGCDILLSLHRENQLSKLLEEAGALKKEEE